MYYIKNGLGPKWRWMAYVFALLGVLTVFGTGNATQVNTIVTAIDSALLNYHVITEDMVSVVNLVLGILIAALVAAILLGGIKRIGNVTEKLVPFMAILYILLGVGVIFFHLDRVPGVFGSIFEGAFSPRAVTGGVVGTMFVSMRRGFSRGIFSNEAGLGTGSIAHACADTDEPVHQGLFGIFEVFMDTIVICTMTALIILCSGVSFEYGAAAGAELTISGFTSTYGNWVSIFTAVAMCCFAFSTTLGWGLFAITDFEQLGVFFTRLFDFTGGVDVLYYLRNYGVSILIGILCSMPIFNYLEKKTQRLPLVQTAFLVLVLVMCTGYLVDATYNPFLYWNF